MEPVPLSCLPEGDPRQRLSPDARGRISEAQIKGGASRDYALANACRRAKAEGNTSVILNNLEVAESEFEHAKSVLIAIQREFIPICETWGELNQIMRGEIEAAVNSLELSLADRNALWSALAVDAAELTSASVPTPARGNSPEPSVESPRKPKPGRPASEPINGTLVLQYRNQLGLSQEELADKSDVSVDTVQRAEGGKRISEKCVVKLAEAFSILLESPVTPGSLKEPQ